MWVSIRISFFAISRASLACRDDAQEKRIMQVRKGRRRAILVTKSRSSFFEMFFNFTMEFMFFAGLGNPRYESYFRFVAAIPMIGKPMFTISGSRLSETAGRNWRASGSP